MKPAALTVALAVWSGWCGGGSADVKTHAVGMIDGKPIHMYTAIYRADASRQTVLWWVEGVPKSQTVLEKCSVRDALNWRCEGGENRAGSVMVDGRYDTLGAVNAEGWKFLTESEWKALQAQQQ